MNNTLQELLAQVLGDRPLVTGSDSHAGATLADKGLSWSQWSTSHHCDETSRRPVFDFDGKKYEPGATREVVGYQFSRARDEFRFVLWRERVEPEYRHWVVESVELLAGPFPVPDDLWLVPSKKWAHVLDRVPASVVRASREDRAGVWSLVVGGEPPPPVDFSTFLEGVTRAAAARGVEDWDADRLLAFVRWARAVEAALPAVRIVRYDHSGAQAAVLDPEYGKLATADWASADPLLCADEALKRRVLLVATERRVREALDRARAEGFTLVCGMWGVRRDGVWKPRDQRLGLYGAVVRGSRASDAVFHRALEDDAASVLGVDSEIAVWIGHGWEGWDSPGFDPGIKIGNRLRREYKPRRDRVSPRQV